MPKAYGETLTLAKAHEAAKDHGMTHHITNFCKLFYNSKMGVMRREVCKTGPLNPTLLIRMLALKIESRPMK